MIQVKRIDHVAIALPELSAAAAVLRRLFDLTATETETVASQRVDVTFLEPRTDAHARGPGASIELVAPGTDAGDTSLARFVAKRGTALHHICFEVEDLAGALRELERAGVELIDRTPRPGARGHLVAFLHPRATGGVLFELCQRHAPDASHATAPATDPTAPA